MSTQPIPEPGPGDAPDVVPSGDPPPIPTDPVPASPGEDPGVAPDQPEVEPPTDPRP